MRHWYFAYLARLSKPNTCLERAIPYLDLDHLPTYVPKLGPTSLASTLEQAPSGPKAHLTKW